MNPKNSSLKYLFLSLIFIIIIYSIHSYKINNIQKSVEEDLNFIETDFQSLLHKKFDTANIIFDTIFENNEFLIALFDAPIGHESKYDSFKAQFEKELVRFKQLSIQKIELYDKKANSLFSNSQNVAVAKVLETYQEFKGFELINNELALRMIKPYFNDQMELLGAIEFVLNIQHMIYEFNHQKNASLKIVYNKNTLQTYLKEDLFKDYELFKSHSSFLIQPTVYDDYKQLHNIYNVAFMQRNDELLEKIDLYQSFATTFTYKDRLYTLMFIPFKSNLDHKNLGYIIAYHSNEHLNMLTQQHYENMLILTITFIIILFLFYTLWKSRYQQKKAQALYENLKMDIDKYVIITETDNQGIITYVSQAFCTVSGYKRDELIGQPQNIIRHPDMSKTFFKNMWSMLLKGESWEGEIKNIDRNGNSYWIRGIIVPIFDEERKIQGYRSIRVNITDEKQLEKVNSILKDDLSMRFNDIKTKDKSRMDESKINLMSKMLDAFANEWKKPISNISLKTLDLETRVKKSMPSKAYLEKYVYDINELNKRLSSNLNQFKHIFHNKNIKEKYNVHDEIVHAVSVIDYDEKITINIEGQTNLYSFGIASDLNKILSSLLNNALEQFQIKNIDNGIINIHLFDENEKILIYVSDNALGIPKDIQKKIFEPDFSTKVDFNSKGLSLYISKLMLQKNGGDLSVKAIENGSCFMIELISKDRRKELL